MSDRWELNQDSFDELLTWLNPNRGDAARKYETIRAGLVQMLRYWGCSAAEELADETINRVAMKVPEMRDTYKGNPARFFYGVAKNVALEYQRKAQKVTTFIDQSHTILSPEPPDELAYECLESCMQKQSAVNRELFRRYFEEDTPEQRKRFAKWLGITEKTLRVRIHRIVTPLKKCVNKCMQQGNPMK